MARRKKITLPNADSYEYIGIPTGRIFQRGATNINLDTISDKRIEYLLSTDPTWSKYFKKVTKPAQDKE